MVSISSQWGTDGPLGAFRMYVQMYSLVRWYYLDWSCPFPHLKAMYHLCRSLKVCCCRDIKCQTVTHSQHGWMYPWTLVWTLITMWIAWVCSTVFAVDPRRIGGLFTAGSLLEVGLNRHLNLGRIFASMKRVRIGSDNGLSLIQHQAIILNNARLLSIGPLGTKGQTSMRFESEYKFFHSRKCIRKYRLTNDGHFVQGQVS